MLRRVPNYSAEGVGSQNKSRIVAGTKINHNHHNPAPSSKPLSSPLHGKARDHF